MAKYSKESQESVKDAMHKLKHGRLKSGKSGKTVKNRKQAIAIGLSEAREEGAKVPKKSSSAKPKRADAPKKTTAAKKTTVKKTAAKKPAVRKTAAKKPAAKKATARKSTAAHSHSSH